MGAAATAGAGLGDAGAQGRPGAEHQLIEAVDRDAVPYILSICVHDKHTHEAYGRGAKMRGTTWRSSREGSNSLHRSIRLFSFRRYDDLQVMHTLRSGADLSVLHLTSASP
jgi:hypothetical protein